MAIKPPALPPAENLLVDGKAHYVRYMRVREEAVRRDICEKNEALRKESRKRRACEEKSAAML